MQKQGFESLAEKTLSDLELRVDLKSAANVKEQTNTPYERLLLFCNGYPYLEGALLNRNESNNPKIEYKILIRTTLDQALNILADHKRLLRSMQPVGEDRVKEVESKRRTQFYKVADTTASAMQAFEEWLDLRKEGHIKPKEKTKTAFETEFPYPPDTTLE